MGEVAPQPPTDAFSHRVQGHHMPLAQVVRVVAFGACVVADVVSAEVVEVAGGVLQGVVLVVAYGRIRSRQDLRATPAGGVAVCELGGGAGLVGVVSGGVNSARDGVQQVGGSLVPFAGAAGYVPRPYEDRICRSDLSAYALL